MTGALAEIGLAMLDLLAFVAVPTLVLVYLIHRLSGANELCLLRLLGNRAYRWLFFPGVVIHEVVGHALPARLAGLKVLEVNVTEGLKNRGEVQGWVRSELDRKRFRHRVAATIMATGPTVFGGALLLVLIHLLLLYGAPDVIVDDQPALGDEGADSYWLVLQKLTLIVSRILTSLGSAPWWKLLIFAYAAVTICCSQNLSPPDQAMARSGWWSFALLLVLVCLGVVLLAQLVPVARTAFVQLVAGFESVLALNLLVAFVVWLLVTGLCRLLGRGV